METVIDRKNLIVGARQSMKALMNGKVKELYMADDSDEFITKDFVRECAARDINIIHYDTMMELGKSCGIEVGTAVACRTVE